MAREEKPPKGGWLGPPPTGGLVPIAVAIKSKKGKWIFKSAKLTDKQREKHAKFQKKMKKADAKDHWRF